MPMYNDKNSSLFFNWRPNDNGALTNIRYRLEASKWANAVNSAQTRLPRGTFMGELNNVGMFLSLPLVLIFLILLIPIQIIKGLFGFNIKVFPGDEPTGWIDKNAPIVPDSPRLKYLKEQAAKNRKPTCEYDSMSQEDKMKLVNFVKAETAKSKARAQSK
ncbi:hypothetical protein [Salinimicrobium sediminilitoris]|uniref:hypothetical protein n=1 Tax=Salinimicrobium sediminilitoris TaxID=2876715 RepID=UPI001E287374|nr:hypothetical protein [Salinimicrobium sediminilitoris]MCC8360276.1 hypothetical protein [Salinimicrobium sediminilitoris]